MRGAGAAAGALKGVGHGADDDDANPWGDTDDAGGDGWALAEFVPRYKGQFEATQRGGLVSGAGAKPLLTATGLPTAKLRKIWELADVDKVPSDVLGVVAFYCIYLTLPRRSLPVPSCRTVRWTWKSSSWPCTSRTPSRPAKSCHHASTTSWCRRASPGHESATPA